LQLIPKSVTEGRRWDMRQLPWWSRVRL
jgi:hypothetical protein